MTETIPIRNLGDAEVEAEIVLRRELSGFIDCAVDTWNVIAATNRLYAGKTPSQMGDKNNICILLLAKIANDLTGMMKLLVLGYPQQAAVVACSAWELTWVMAYVTVVDDKRAAEWYSHTNTKKPFHGNLRETIYKVARTIYSNQPESEVTNWSAQQYKVYEQFSMIRHGNPQALQLELTEDGHPKPVFGPRSGPEAIHGSKVIAFHVLGQIHFALASWFKLHVDDAQLVELAKDLKTISNTLLALHPGREQSR